MAAAHPDRAAPLRIWLLQHVCPFWMDRVLDPQGGFYEALDAASQAVMSLERTILNQARLTYVASHAFMMGGDARMRQAADHGFAFMKKANADAPLSGWPRRLTVEGAVTDAARDAYDHAFVIFAMAWYHRATGSTEAVVLAGQALDFMQSFLADTQHGGYFEEYPNTDKLPRRQNPHMHLLEAVLAMHESTGDARWLLEAKKLVDLFEQRFTDRDSGALVEYFDRDWSIAAGAAGQLREPGHQFEWVWLLGQYARLSTDFDLAPAADRLFAFGTRFGIEKDSTMPRLAFDGVDTQGQLVADTKLLWPQTEYIKACLQMFEEESGGPLLDVAHAHTALMRQHFFMPDGANWVNQLTRDGKPAVDVTPSRVLYHLFLAMAELIRVEEDA